MKVLANCEQGLNDTQKLQARDNISCKSRQNPLELNYADYGFLKKLTQNAEGVVNAECSYISAATSETMGLMSTSDKSKLDGIQSGAQVNQNAWSNLKVGSTTISAANTTDTFELSAGSHVTITPDVSNKKITISAADTTYNVFDTTTDGLVPKSGANTDKFLKGDGTWGSPLTSVTATAPLAGTGTSSDPLVLHISHGLSLVQPSGGTTALQVTHPVPAPETTDAGKFLQCTDALGNLDWVSSSGGTQVYKQNNGQGGIVETSVSKLSLDTDYNEIIADGTTLGIYVPAPNTPSTAKVLEVAAGSDIPSWVNPAYVEYIQFNYSNQSTAQDAVYTAIANAYAAGKLPILWCAVANASLYWMPTAYGANGYSFTRGTNNYHYLATIDPTTHVFTISQSEIVDYTAGTNVTIDSNHQISATDTTYTAGYGIAINSSNVISNTMHQDTYGLMISYNTLVNSGTTEHTIGPWKIRVVKDAMAAFDSSPSTGGSLHIYFAHSDYLDGSITNGRTLVDTYEPWADGNYATVYQAHNQWGFNGSYSAGPSNGYQIGLISPDYDNTPAKACPTHMRGYKFTINCGIDRADWLECEANALYINNNTSITSNALRLLLRFKYFYV